MFFIGQTYAQRRIQNTKGKVNILPPAIVVLCLCGAVDVEWWRIVNNLPPIMSRHHCPYCVYAHTWSVRRHARKCTRCRREWVPSRYLVHGVRADERAWKVFLTCFLRYRTVEGVRLHTHQSRPTILKMSALVRTAMADDVPEVLQGTVEVDETYIGPQWRNRRWVERKRGTKKGRGTEKQAVFGIRERARGIVRTFLVPNVQKRTLMALMLRHIERGSTIYSDAYQLYQETPKEGYVHDFVDHKQHEYGRGDVHSNGMEGFWGVLKRRLKTTGGIKRDRLSVYVAEETWRYNNRTLSETEKINRLITFLKVFGG